MSDRPELLPAFAQLEEALKKNWRLGQNMVLCWSPHEAGVLALIVPHYFLGNLTASAHARGDAEGMEQFVRGVIGTSRLKSDEELFAIAQRLQVSTTFIKLDTPFKDDQALQLADQIIRRYGLGFVESRAVVLFDIAEFSLHAPFEQASQLNSLSYSMNSAYHQVRATRHRRKLCQDDHWGRLLCMESRHRCLPGPGPPHFFTSCVD